MQEARSPEQARGGGCAAYFISLLREVAGAGLARLWAGAGTCDPRPAPRLPQVRASHGAAPQRSPRAARAEGARPSSARDAAEGQAGQRQRPARRPQATAAPRRAHPDARSARREGGAWDMGTPPSSPARRRRRGLRVLSQLTAATLGLLPSLHPCPSGLYCRWQGFPAARRRACAPKMLGVEIVAVWLRRFNG